MIKVGNQTNSQDPQAVNSRVFVGNLNTFQATKTDVERLFQRYGRIAGISMHKGFAFIQFTNPLDARSACMGEDARNIFGQVLDVNMVAEPKPTLAIRKRHQQQHPTILLQPHQTSINAHNTAADWLSTSVGGNTGPYGVLVDRVPGSVSSSKASTTANHHSLSTSPSSVLRTPSPASFGKQLQDTVCLDDLKTYSSPDVLICGNCREMFGDVMDMIDHKRNHCKLRFVCKCSEIDLDNITSGSKLHITCALCKETFLSAWDMMVHFQSAHTVNVYRLGSASKQEARSESAASEGSCISADDSAEKSETATEDSAAVEKSQQPDEVAQDANCTVSDIGLESTTMYLASGDSDSQHS